MKIKPGQKIIFIGDSITEDSRFEDEVGLGAGYVRYIHDYFLVKHPKLNLFIENKGISGNRIIDLYNRWNEDVLSQKADWISISIGVNDVWRQLDKPEIEQVFPDKFESIYRKLLDSIQQSINSKVIMMEPTIIGEDIDSEGNKRLKSYVGIIKQLCSEYNTIHVPMHQAFITFLKQNSNKKLTIDGVHMNSLGRMLMMNVWLNSLGFD